MFNVVVWAHIVTTSELLLALYGMVCRTGLYTSKAFTLRLTLDLASQNIDISSGDRHVFADGTSILMAARPHFYHMATSWPYHIALVVHMDVHSGTMLDQNNGEDLLVASLHIMSETSETQEPHE